MDAFSSQITFLNFNDFEAGKQFLSGVLGLEAVYDIGWAVVYRISGTAFLGAVDKRSTDAPALRDAMLISLTTGEIERWHRRVSEALADVSPIREIPDAGLRSFFFRGPEGYQFEIQQFTQPQPLQLFGR